MTLTYLFLYTAAYAGGWRGDFSSFLIGAGFVLLAGQWIEARVVR